MSAGAARPRVVAIIQARMASSRLPGKVLEELAGRPVLTWMMTRARRASTVDEVVVATTTDPSDDPIAALCQGQGYPHTRGSMHDVLDRYYQTARQFEAEVIVRLTGDCPLIDPDLINQAVETLLNSDPPYDFVANRLPAERSTPIGLDTEVCTFAALQAAWQHADQPYQREHVMPYLYEQPGRFNTHLIHYQPDYGHLRWTVDTPEDLVLLRRIVDHFEERDDFSWRQVIELFEQHPELAQINAQVQHKGYHDSDERAAGDA